MANSFEEYFKRDTVLDHVLKCPDDLSWYGTCPHESTEIAEQIYCGADADFWSNAFAVGSIVCFLASLFLFDLSMWIIVPIAALVAWAVVYKVKVRITKAVNITYEMDDKTDRAAQIMLSPFSDIASCEKIKQITGSENFSDTNHIKNNGGSNCELSQKDASAGMKLPFPVKTKWQGATLEIGGVKVLALADCVYILDSKKCTPVPYLRISWSVSACKIIEENPPSDAEIVGETWQHVNVDGSPDKRFNENKKLMICRYGKVSVSFGDELTFKLLISSADAARRISEFVSSINKD